MRKITFIILSGLLLQGCGSTSDSTQSGSSDQDNGSNSETDSLTYAIVDTNQTTCFNSNSGNTTDCNNLGYDADYSGNQPSYTASSSGLSVTDNVTRLVWTQSTDINGDGAVDYDDKLYQSEAVTYCSDLELDSRTDWRLPNVKEAYSLILFSGKDASSYTGTDTSTLTLFIDDAFGDLDATETSHGVTHEDRIIDGQYASTSIYVSTTMNGDNTMFGVNYVDGRIKGYPTVTKEFYVRCVTGNTEYSINDFTDNGDDTISDLATDLMWQKNDFVSTDWEDAITECESVSSANHNDWRLPNAKELQSLLDYSRSPDTDSGPALDPIFNSTSFTNEENILDWGYYWASTTHMDDSGEGSNATYVSFGRALGYMNDTILDVHGAGSQRSNDKVDVSTEPGAASDTDANELFYYKGPQGDILRLNNLARCVRDIN